jgi:hypothetical protein
MFCATFMWRVVEEVRNVLSSVCVVCVCVRARARSIGSVVGAVLLTETVCNVKP